jgi:hypothetical protein
MIYYKHYYDITQINENFIDTKQFYYNNFESSKIWNNVQNLVLLLGIKTH